MTTLTTQQAEILRTQNHSTKLSLSIYKPPTLLACLVNSTTIARGARTIPFDTVSTGAYTNVYANTIMYVGTTLGGMDVGRIRVRSITSTTITVAENSDIDWANNLFLTIVDFVEISAIYPRIIKDPADDENVIFYKDYNVAYTNQNSVLGTLICMGSHRAADLVDGSAQLYYTAAGTYNVKGDGLTYLWEFGGASSSGTSTIATPGYVTYDTPGEYKTKLTITNASGGTDISYRYVSIHDPDHPPILKWELGNLSGSRDSGGYTASMKVYEDITSVHPNALVVIYADDWYGTNHVSLGGNQTNNSETVFVGYILENSIKYNYAAGYVEFSVGSPTEIMKLCEGFSISVESAVTASTWFQIDNMTTSKAIYHYLKTHSTIPCVTDVRYVADNRLVQYFDSDRTSLFDAIDNFLKTGMIGGLISDRQGTLWAEIHPPAIDDAFTAIPNAMTISKRDWMESPSIDEKRTKLVSWVELGGIAYSGAATNTFSALLSNAPGIAPSYQGRTENPYPGLILENQIQLNWLSGNYLEYQNAKYPGITMNFAGNYRNIDIAPLEGFIISLGAEDTFSGKVISPTPFHVASMDWSYNALQESLIPNVTFHEITEGYYGETVIIPDIPPDDGYAYPEYGDYDYDKFPYNPELLPDIVIPVTSTETFVLIHDHYRRGMFYTSDFESDEPTWYNNNEGMASGTYLHPTFVLMDGTTKVYLTDGNVVWYASSPDAVYSVVMSATQMQALSPYAYNGISAMGINESSGQIGLMATWGTWAGGGQNSIVVGDSSGFSTVNPAVPGGPFGTLAPLRSLRYGGGYWSGGRSNFFAASEVSVFSPSTFIRTTGGLGSGNAPTVFGLGSSPSAFALNIGFNQLYRTDDNFATFYSVNPACVVNIMATDITGQYLMGISGNSLLRSPDGGVSWEDITASLPNDPLFFPKGVTSIDGNKWIVGGSFYVADYWNTRINLLFTADFGETWVSKMGNLEDFLFASGTVDGYEFDMIRVLQ